MQCQRFTTGGFVLHRIDGRRGFSAWFDAAGKLEDAEKMDARGRMRRVTSRADLARLKTLGRVWRAAQ